MNTIEKEGAWCWFADPRALTYKGKTYVGCIDVHGNIKADMLEDGKKTSVLVRSNFQPDDHDNPTFLVLPDERIMIIYSRHTDEACFYYRISKKKNDITELGAEKRLETEHNTTYPSLFIMDGDEEHIYLCYRGKGWHPTCACLSMPDENDNVTFVTEPFQIVQSTIQGAGCRPYAKYVSDKKGKIHIVYSATHPDNVCPTCVYYSCLDVRDYTLYDIEGNVLKKNVDESPFVVTGYETDPAFVVDDYRSSERGWVWDVCLRDEGIAAAIVRIAEDKKTQKYYYAYYENGEWQKVFLANARKFHKSDIEYCYGGGMSLDREDKGVIYASVPMGTAFEIEKYTVGTHGVVREDVTKESKYNNIRPYKPEGGELMWMSGDYWYWIVNASFPKGFPTSIVYGGKELCDKYELTAEIECTKDSEGTIYDDGEAKIEVRGFDVFLNGLKSTNALSTSDWNKEHTATTDGSAKLVRPESVIFGIVKTDDKIILMRDNLIDIVSERR